MDARDHAVFTELRRVRQYFDKIKRIESPPLPRGAGLNKEAAIRFLKADLVGLRMDPPGVRGGGMLRQS